MNHLPPREGPLSPSTSNQAIPSSRYWLRVIAVISDSLLMALIFTALPPVLPAIGHHFNDQQQGRLIAQLIMTVPSIGLICGGLIAGWLVDRFNPRTVLFAGLSCFAVFGSAGLYLDQAAPLLLSRFFLGVSSAAITTASTWLLACLFDPAARAQLLGYRNAFGSLGGVLSTLLAGPMAEVAGWRAPFSFYLVALIILFFVAAIVPRIPRHQPKARDTGHQQSLRHLWAIYLVAVPTAVMMFATITQVSFLLADLGFTNPTTQSWVIGVGSGTSVIGAALYGTIRHQFGPSGSFTVLLALMGAGNMLIGLSHTPHLIAVGTAIAGIGSGLANPYLCNLILDRADLESRGRALGLLYSAMFVGDFLNPVVFSPLSAFLGLQGAFVVTSTILIVSAGIICIKRPRWTIDRNADYQQAPQ